MRRMSKPDILEMFREHEITSFNFSILGELNENLDRRRRVCDKLLFSGNEPLGYVTNVYDGYGILIEKRYEVLQKDGNTRLIKTVNNRRD